MKQQHPYAPIVFSDQDLKSTELPHTNPLIINLLIVDAMVSSLLVEEWSSSYIIFLEAFQKMGVDLSLISPNANTSSHFQ